MISVIMTLVHARVTYNPTTKMNHGSTSNKSIIIIKPDYGIPTDSNAIYIKSNMQSNDSSNNETSSVPMTPTQTSSCAW